MARSRSPASVGALTAAITLWCCCAAPTGCRDAARERAELRAAVVANQGPAFLRHYAELASAGYTEAARAARDLSQAIRAFLAAPTGSNLELAKQAWVRARVPYLQTEVFRFYDGPIDQVERFINSWPTDENYIEGLDTEGIVTNVAQYPDLTADLLRSLNERGGETNLSVGVHPIEYLLWGRDTDPRGPGKRPPSDYVLDEKSATRARNERRRRYLELSAELLVRDLERVAEEWAPDRPGNYRARFLALPPSDALGLVFKGVAALSGAELGGERLTVPYATKNSEDEHSCFSDNTQADLVSDTLGIENLCRGTYQPSQGARLTGPGLCALVAGIDPELGDALRARARANVDAARAVPHPFDQAVLGSDDAPGRVAVQRLIQTLEAFSSELGRAATALQVSVPDSAKSSALSSP